MVKVFISHCSQDSPIAQALAELFRTAMHLSKSDIRCTSVDGYRLPAGANTDEQLRREVLEAHVLVGLVSHQSFESAYVLFELGARWGKNSFMAPVLAPGVAMSVLRGPLSALNALSCESASQVHQLVFDIASQLGVPLEPAAAYQELVEAVTHSRSNVQQEKSPSSLISPHSHPTESSSQDEYAEAEATIKAHCESQWGDDYSMRVHCEEQQRKAVEELRLQSSDGVPADVFKRIRAKGAREWPDDFEMRLHTENEQLEAYRKLQRPK